MRGRPGGKCMAAAALAALAPAAHAQSVTELAELSIEELAQVEVTSASKRAEPVSGAPTAIYVITEEEIQRSPATSLPQLLRHAPNLDVQRIDARQYAITARGFNGYETANKLLALIDGRSIYTTLFSGIFWELHQPVLEDLQQIEVVSGPGGTLFGPNAVNGVISVTSKDAFATQGGLARATLAANDRTAALRYGGALGGAGAFRVYGNVFDRDDLPDGTGPDVDDGHEGFQAGFRTDFGTADNRITVQGDIFDTRTKAVSGDGENGHNLLARWTRGLGGASSLSVRAYYDDFEREFTLVRDALETFDLEGQYTGEAGRHQFVAGFGVRTTSDLFDNDLNPFVLNPESRRLWIYNAFVQDRITLNEQLALTAGVKFEQSTLSGFEILPNLRLAWQPNDRTLLWSAVSRAVRTPSRIDRNLQFLPILAPALDFQSEELTAIEAGYRGRPTDSTSLSVSLFYNLYDKLRTTEFAPGGALPIMLANSLEGRTWGIEAWATQQVTPWWRLRLGLVTLGKDFEVKADRTDITGGESAGNDPDYRLFLRSQMDLSDSVQLDFGVRAVDDLENPEVASYVEADARLAWRATRNLELFVAGTNLLHRAHEESGEPQRSQLVERSVHAGTRVRF